MSLLSKSHARTATTAGLGILLLTGVSVWRLGIEFERVWLASLAAPPEPFERAATARALSALAGSWANPPAAPAAVPELAAA
jgi:hypothetical protein